MKSRKHRFRRSKKLRDGVTAFAFLFGVAVIAAYLGRFDAISVMGQFQAVDGDSLILNGQRFRLEGIDAPELDQQCTKSGVKWPCGRDARDHLARLISNGLTCEGGERDAWDRILVICTHGANEVNRTMVADGFAVSYGRYWQVERDARIAARGIWAGEFTHPRAYRDGLMGDGGETMPMGFLVHVRSLASRGLAWIKNGVGHGE